MKYSIIWIFGVLLLFSGCGTTGKDFDDSRIQKIVNGISNKNEIKVLLGEPFKIGVQNGFETWTYEYNEYNMIGPSRSKDAIIVFTPDGIVKSHQYMVNEPLY